MKPVALILSITNGQSPLLYFIPFARCPITSGLKANGGLKSRGVFDLGVYVFSNKINMVTFGTKQLRARLIDENVSSYKYQLSVKMRSKKKGGSTSAICMPRDHKPVTADAATAGAKEGISDRGSSKKNNSEFINSLSQTGENTVDLLYPATPHPATTPHPVAAHPTTRTPVVDEHDSFESGFKGPNCPELSAENCYIWYDLETHEFLSKVVDEQVLRIFQGCVQRVDCDAFENSLDFRFLYTVVAGGQNIAAIKDDVVGLAHQIMVTERLHQYMNKFTATAFLSTPKRKAKSSSKISPEPIYPPHSLPITLIALAKYITDVFPYHFGLARNVCSIDKQSITCTPTRTDYDMPTASRPYSIASLVDSPGYTPPMGAPTRLLTTPSPIPSPITHNATLPVMSTGSLTKWYSGPSNLRQTPSRLRQTLGIGQLASVIHSTIRASKVSGDKTPSSSPTPSRMSPLAYLSPNAPAGQHTTGTSDYEEHDCLSRYGLSPTMGIMRITDSPKRCSLLSPAHRNRSNTVNFDTTPSPFMKDAGSNTNGLWLSTPSQSTYEVLTTPSLRSSPLARAVGNTQMEESTRLLTPDSLIHTPNPEMLVTPKLVKWAASPATPPTYTPSVMSTISVRSNIEDPSSCNIPEEFEVPLYLGCAFSKKKIREGEVQR